MRLRSVCIIHLGGKTIYANFWDKTWLLQKWRKYALRESAAKCAVITKDFNAVRDLAAFWEDLSNFSFCGVACGGSISQNTLLLLFHYNSLPLATPPLLWSKFFREAALMNVVNEGLKDTFQHHNIKTSGMGRNERRQLLSLMIQTGGTCWPSWSEVQPVFCCLPISAISPGDSTAWSSGIIHH